MIATVVNHYPKVGDAPGQQRLRQAIGRLDRGQIDQAALDAVADDVTAEVIREQERAGLDLVTDGQIRWQDPLTYICRQLKGFEITGLIRWFESNTYFRKPLATGPVEWQGSILRRDYEFARKQTTLRVKAVVTGPYTIATLSDTRHHRSQREFVLDLARALNQELRDLAAISPAWIQVDEPAIVDNPSARYPRDFDLFAEAMGVLTDGVNAPLSLYLYHGSAADLPGLRALPFKLIGLDMVQGEANWRLLESWPAEKNLGLGLIDARNVRLEDADQLRDQLRTAAAAVADGAGEIHLSPSCGLEFLPREVALAKIELVAAAARRERVSV